MLVGIGNHGQKDQKFIERTGKEEKCPKHYPLGGKFERCLCYIHPTKVIESVDKALNFKFFEEVKVWKRKQKFK
ncbi:MAG: hypothetical protein Ct9H90mP4_10230 [Gammaproteobacteria bacterium]|nr:MAG: hypothetical protein Ct9H90mP4_10230 [Gammaproteobacteria bacterium]